ncbi:MAG: DNA integrity scanning protein DisA nucleotide-binding domain protein, partial [Planctomycetes bacterium]|nr:DNA integrity scanning protein DisA nucleotide-binding domain protein [Planctomycetota bacterium]
ELPHTGVFSLTPERVIKSLRDELSSAFTDLTSMQIDRLIDLVEVAEMESRGTILVISRDAQSEAARLTGQNVPIEPARLTPKLLKLLTAIDGAILISPDATCYAIGAILDGVAQGKGDSSRGARYNSALRYLQSVDGDCIAVVVSEDGGVDIVTRQTGLE